MSYHSHFGAYVVPQNSGGPVRDFETVSHEFGGSSRSEWFQKACKTLLDAMPGHDLLRFLSAESSTLVVNAHGGELQLSLIQPNQSRFILEQLDDLLKQCAERPGELLALWDRQEDSTTEVVHAVASMRTCRLLNEEADGAEEGESPRFAIASLTTVRSTILRVCGSGADLVYFTWR